MRYKIELSKKVKKFLANHDLISRQFYDKIFYLANNDSKNLDIKKLSGEVHKYRLRIGKYRFLYEIIDEKILIFFYDANSRGDIY
ncbi:MAG: hypothetical protein PHS49_02890 [Candidatus Gracilibacteria bacterium]|nr:hypothetical protein [Candidatus Gracilibacteria bacterium]